MTNPIITNTKDGVTFEQLPEDTILRAALRAGIGMTHECNSGGCGACKFELISGEIQTLWSTAPGLSDRDRSRGRHLACQCRALDDISIKATISDECKPPITPSRQQATFLGSSNISHDIKEFRFLADKHANFLPGQFAMLEIPGVGSPRAYSMSNISNHSNEWHFQIRRVTNGSGTKALFDDIREGSQVGLDGPYGLAHLRQNSERDIVCIAGGSGLAPMISIARGAAESGLLENKKLFFFYGARTPNDVCGENILSALEGFGNSIQYIPVVSHVDENIEWHGQRGFVHQALNSMLDGELNNYEFYFAGPPPMTQALQELLMVEHKVPFNQVHFDRFF